MLGRLRALVVNSDSTTTAQPSPKRDEPVEILETSSEDNVETAPEGDESSQRNSNEAETSHPANPPTPTGAAQKLGAGTPRRGWFRGLFSDASTSTSTAASESAKGSDLEGALDVLRCGLCQQAKLQRLGLVGEEASSPETDFHLELVCGMQHGEGHGCHVDGKFAAYSPNLFASLRSSFQIPDDILLSSFQCETGDMVVIRPSTSKSGRSFHLTPNHQFILITVSRAEASFLLELLPHFCQHASEHPCTLLPRYCGLYHAAPITGSDGLFLVMTHVFSAPHKIHHKFDLKGSSVGRKTVGEQHVWEENEVVAMRDVMKDLDLTSSIELGPMWKNCLERQLAADCMFLQSLDVVDYSLLLGVHEEHNEEVAAAASADSAVHIDKLPRLYAADFDKDITFSTSHAIVLFTCDSDHRTRALCEDLAEMLAPYVELHPEVVIRWVNIAECNTVMSASLNVMSIPTTVCYEGGVEVQRWIGVFESSTSMETHLGPFVQGDSPSPWPRGHMGFVGPWVSIFHKDAAGIRGLRHTYHIGIVDILTTWNLKKMLEHSFKSLVQKKDEMTIIEPKLYSERFLRYLRGIIK